MSHSGKLSVNELYAFYLAGGDEGIRRRLGNSDALVVFPDGGKEASITWTPHRATQTPSSTPSSGELSLAETRVAVAPALPKGSVIAPLTVDKRKQACVVGRGWGCGIKLKSLDVSRAHARFCVDDSGLWSLEDLGSNNGTFVDGLRIQPRTTVVVHPYREIRFANVRTMLLDSEAVVELCRAMTG